MNSSSIKQGLSWNSLSILINVFQTFVLTAILARILSPTDFGLMGIAQIFLSLSMLVTDFGLQHSIIQDQKITNKQINYINNLNIYIGLFVAIILFFLSPYIAYFFQEKSLVNVIRLITLSFFIQSFSLVYKALLQKKFQFKYLVIFNAIGQLTRAIIAISLALLDYGVYSLIVGVIGLNIVEFLLFRIFCKSLWYKEVSNLKVDFKEIEDKLKYGSYLVGFNLLNYTSQNFDKIIVGSMFGPKEVGYFTIVVSLISIPQQQINPVLTKVIFPALSKFQDNNEKMQKYYLKLQKIVSLIAFPMLIGLFFLADEFILIVYGDQWIGAVPILRIMCFVGIIRALLNPNGTVFLAKAKTDLQFKINIFNIGSIFITVYLFSFININGVAYGYLLVGIVFFFIIHYYTNGLIELRNIELFRSYKIASFGSIGMLAIIYFTNELIISTYGLISRFIMIISIGILVYVVLIICFDKELRAITKRNIKLNFKEKL